MTRNSDMTMALVAGDRPDAATSPVLARVARRRVLPLAVVCAAVGILGTTACAAGLGRGESALESAAAESVRPGQVFRDCDVCPEMVVVPTRGKVAMWPESEVGRDDSEGHVTIAEPFAIGVNEVTAAEWDACVRGGGCGGWVPTKWFVGGGDSPVIDVSWHDAVAYARWLSERTGREYRLPSDAEWEHAARAGTEPENPFRSGLCRMPGDGSNARGPCGMIGGAEWTADCSNEDYSGARAKGNDRRLGDRFRCLARLHARPGILPVDRSWYHADRREQIRIRVVRTMN